MTLFALLGGPFEEGYRQCDASPAPITGFLQLVTVCARYPGVCAFQRERSGLVVEICHLILPIVAIGAAVSHIVAVLDDKGQVSFGVAQGAG